MEELVLLHFTEKHGQEYVVLLEEFDGDASEHCIDGFELKGIHRFSQDSGPSVCMLPLDRTLRTR